MSKGMQKAMYLKGLVENTPLDPKDPRDKLILVLTEALEELAQEAEAMDKRFQENEKVNGEMRAFMAGLLAHAGDELDDDFHDLYDDEDEYDEDEDPDFATLDDDGNDEESDDDIPDSSSDDDFLRFLRDLARKK